MGLIVAFYLKANRLHYVTPHGVPVCFFRFSRDSAAKAAPSPGYYISPLNRGSLFRSLSGCHSFSLPPDGGNFTIRRADNFARAAGENFAARQGNFAIEYQK